VKVGGCTTGFFNPAQVSGVVRKVATGVLDLGMEGHRGRYLDMGTTVIFDVGPITLMISELRGLGGNVPSVYRKFGIEPADYKIAVLKTASNFQYFAPITSEVIRADTPGPTQSDIEGLPWVRVPRPLYPFDDETQHRL
jgi:microcystin degradation protein MlrC